jgi:hypothetical protein
MKRKFYHAIIALLIIGSFSILPLTSALALTTYTSHQDVTAYVSAKGNKTHSGKNPYQGACAVHPWTVGEYGNGPAAFPFGTIATLSVSVPMYPGNTSRSIFTVEDTGDYNFDLSPWFIDVWQGTDNVGGPIWTWCVDVFEIKTADITFTY